MVTPRLRPTLMPVRMAESRLARRDGGPVADRFDCAPAGSLCKGLRSLGVHTGTPRTVKNPYRIHHLVRRVARFPA